MKHRTIKLISNFDHGVDLENEQWKVLRGRSSKAGCLNAAGIRGMALVVDCPTLFHESQSNNMSNLAGLLAHPIVMRPSHRAVADSDAKTLHDNLEGYTAAGLLRILT